MMSQNDRNKKEGEHILNNYKKQLAEKMAREKANKGDISMKSGSVKESSRSYNNKFRRDDDDDEKMSRMGGDFGGNEPPEPEILLSILQRKSKN